MSPLQFVQSNLFTLIDRPNFVFQLPSLDRLSWESIVSSSEERERLEFTGDAYMAAAVTENLYRVIPKGSPHIYTVARSALTANTTFARIMDRLGFNSPEISTKSSGDAFEAIIGAAKKENLKALDYWFRTNYMQLVIYTADACRSLPSKGKSAKLTPLLAIVKLRLLGRGSPAKQRRSALSSPGRIIRKKRRLLNSPSIRARRTIDLTVDDCCSESKDDDADGDIVQISFDEFARSRQRNALNRCPPATKNMADPRLGAPTNPIVVD
jgi:hypothetical protein